MNNIAGALYRVLRLLLNIKSNAQSVSGTCQQFVVDAAKISNIFGFSNFTR